MTKWLPRWTSAIAADARPLDHAAEDLERICDHVAESSPDAAGRVATIIVEGVASLRMFPNRGRPGRVEGTREFVFASLPFVAVYEVHDDVYVLRILHGSQRWPPH